MQKNVIKSMLRNKKGFTLMELIIVITILAILVTLALLYYGNLTDNARRVALLADLNQVDKAIALYENQYNTLPLVTGALDLRDEIGNVGTDVGGYGLPSILNTASIVSVQRVNEADPNLRAYVKKTTYLFKPGMESGDTRGAGKLYYVTAVNNIASGTAQAGGQDDEIVLEAATAQANDYFNEAYVYITDGTGAGQSRKIIDFDGATDTATVESNWDVNPDGTSTYVIKPTLNVGDLVFLQSTTVETNEINDEAGYIIYKY